MKKNKTDKTNNFGYLTSELVKHYKGEGSAGSIFLVKVLFPPNSSYIVYDYDYKKKLVKHLVEKYNPTQFIKQYREEWSDYRFVKQNNKDFFELSVEFVIYHEDNKQLI